MIYLDKKDHSEDLKKSIDYLEGKGFENIKADLKGYETPKTYKKKDGDIDIIPDIVAERAGIKHYFELGIKTEKPQLLKSKWRFLEVLSDMRNHKFKIITRRGHYKFTNEILSDLKLQKKPIRL